MGLRPVARSTPLTQTSSFARTTTGSESGAQFIRCSTSRTGGSISSVFGSIRRKFWTWVSDAEQKL